MWNKRRTIILKWKFYIFCHIFLNKFRFVYFVVQQNQILKAFFKISIKKILEQNLEQTLIKEFILINVSDCTPTILLKINQFDVFFKGYAKRWLFFCKLTLYFQNKFSEWHLWGRDRINTFLAKHLKNSWFCLFLHWEKLDFLIF